MCLSTVYAIGTEKTPLCKNIAAVRCEADKLVFTDIMGVTTEVFGCISHVDLMENGIYIKQK